MDKNIYRGISTLLLAVVIGLLVLGNYTQDKTEDVKETQETETVTEIEKITPTSLAGITYKVSEMMVESKEAEPTPTTEVKVESYIHNDPLNQKEPYNSMSADWGAEVYEEGFKYYEIPQKYKDDGGEFPEVVQVYLWSLCKEKNLDYYLVLALIERESHYKYDCEGDYGNSLGYMQIYQKYHYERMEKEGVSNLLDPYGNIRVGTTFLQELFKDYGNSGENCVLMVYNMGAGGANRCWRKGIYSSEYSRGIVARAQEIKKELQAD